MSGSGRPRMCTTGASHRLFTIGLAALAMIWIALFVRRTFGDPWIAAVGLLLLAIDPSFVVLSRMDWGPTVVSMLCKSLAAWQVATWWDTGRRRALLVAGLALGIGLWDKASFSWFLAAYPLAVVGVLGRRAILRVRPVDLAVGLGGLIVGALPFAVYNFQSDFASVEAIATPYFRRGPSGGVLAQLSDRVSSFVYLLNGQKAVRYLWLAPRTSAVVPLLFGAGLLYVTAQFVLKRRDRGTKGAAIALAVIVLLLVACAATPGAFKVHHLYATYPFPHLVIAYALVDGGRRLARSGLPLAVAPTGIAVVLAVVLLVNGAAIHTLYQAIHRTGGLGWFSDVVYQAAEDLWGRGGPPPTVVTIDWGIQLPLAAVTDVRYPIDELTFFLLGATTDQAVERLRPLITAPRLVVVTHVRQVTLFHAARERFDTALARLGARAETMAVLRTRTGSPVYELLRIAPAPGEANHGPSP